LSSKLELYSNYIGFKGWSDSGPNENELELHDLEMARLGLESQASIFELGFGNGGFLSWAKSKGHRTYGIELIPELVSRAKKMGHSVETTSLADLGNSPFLNNKYDLIAAFDVLEHLTVDETRSFLRFCKSTLTADGKILIRTPNCSSPFGLWLQMADTTHVTMLSPERLEHIASLEGLRLHRWFNSARPLRTGKKSPLIRRLRYLGRDFVERIFGLLYYGSKRPLDPNMTVHLIHGNSI
jgi:2-polyprenyl-3-methyl-5-hydroxy-6-metoxy-1,4-benzoquinol methylase